MATNALIRSGIWAIAVAGVLTALPWLAFFLSGPPAGPGSDQGSFARLSTGPLPVIFGNMYVLGVLCLLFGLMAIHGYLAGTAVGRWSAIAMIFGVVSLVGVAALWVILTYVDAVLGDLYLAGNTGTAEAYNNMSGGHWGPRFATYFIVMGISGLIATISLGLGLWRSQVFPRWIAVLLAIGFLGTVFTAPFTAFAALLLIVSGVGMARRVARQPVAVTTL